MTLRTLPVPDALIGERVDAALARMLGFSRTVAAQIADAGGVSMDNRTLSKSDRLTQGWLDVDVPDAKPVSQLRPVEVPDMGIVYEDDDVVVVDKPVGVAAHPSVGWEGPTVVEALLAGGHRVATSGASERQGIVSRLDVGTSGLMVVAKTEPAYAGLKWQFKQRTPVKVYHALAQGHVDPLSGTIDAPIARHPGSQWKFAVVDGGRQAVTHYQMLEMVPRATLLEIHLETGRTHQIRVHFAALRHPLVGDLTYGADPVLASQVGLDRQWLHATRLGFEQPVTGQWIEVESAYPPDLDQALTVLRTPVFTSAGQG